VNSILEYLVEIDNKIEGLKKRFPDENIVICFRGESKDYKGSRMKPTIFRDNSPKSIKSIERKTFESVQDYNISNNSNCLLHKAIDTQHYIAYSRLLDVSFNALIALFFALDYDFKKDDVPRVYILGIPQRFSFSPNSNYLNKLFDNIVEGDDENISDNNHKLILPSMINERIIAQDGGLVLFPGSHYQAIPQCYIDEVIINKDNQEKYFEILREWFNIEDSKVYPEKMYMKKRVKKDNTTRMDYSSSDENLEIDLFMHKLLIEVKYQIMQVANNNIIEILRIKRLYKKIFITKITQHYLKKKEY